MKPKNVLIIHADQLRYDGLGANGNAFARTPHIDALASEACVFDRHIVGNSICEPSRASFFTGLYPWGHGVWCNGIPLNRKEYQHIDHRHEGSPSQGGYGGFQPEPPTMADVFADGGYDTASFGKLHFTPNMAPSDYLYPENYGTWESGKMDDWHGPYYGFRYVDFVIPHGESTCLYASHYALWLKEHHPELHRRVAAGLEPRPLAGMSDLYQSCVPHSLHHSQWLANRFSAYLTMERPKDKPFFAFVGFPDPHHPFTPSFDVAQQFENTAVPDPLDWEGQWLKDSPAAKLCQMSEPLPYSREEFKTVIRYTYAMIHQIDRAVGTMIAALKAQGLYEDTIIVVTSDHGDFLGDHRRLMKGFVGVDSLLRVPLIVRAPGEGLPARWKGPVSNVDVLPTLAALTKVKLPDWQHGRNLVEVMQPQSDDHYALAFCSNGSPFSVNLTIYSARYRLTWYPWQDFTEMYDQSVDPGETHNLWLSDCRPKEGEFLRAELMRRALRATNPIFGRLGAW